MEDAVERDLVVGGCFGFWKLVVGGDGEVVGAQPEVFPEQEGGTDYDDVADD